MQFRAFQGVVGADLESVVLGRIVARCDHESGSSGIGIGGKVEHRGRTRSNVGQVQPGGQQSLRQRACQVL